MKKLLIPSLLAGLSLNSQGAITALINANSRTIDVETTTSGNLISLADLQSQVTATGDLSKAGILSGETAGDALTTIATELTGASATFTFSGPNRYSRNDAVAALSATSGSRFGLIAGSNNWSLGSSTPGEGVTHFGAIFYGFASTGSANLVSVTATFSDLSSTVYNATASAQEYSFVGFKAPAGEFITDINIVETNGGDWLGYDDVTIVSGVAVPEPSSTALLGLGGLGLLLRRKK